MTMIEIDTINEHNIDDKHVSVMSIPYKKTKPTPFLYSIIRGV